MKRIVATCVAASCLFASGPLLAQRTALAPLPMEQLQTLAAVFGMINADSVKQTDPPGLIIAGIRGMVREADPENGAYYDPKDFAEFRAGKGEESSMSGVQLARREGRFLLQPTLGGPAMAAGVRGGDVLYAVNGARIGNLETHQVAALLAGPLDSTYSITVFRESSLSVLTLSVQRRPSVGSEPRVMAVAPGVALVQVLQYRDRTLEETARMLKAAWQKEPFHRGLVLDLRGSTGGLLTGAIGLASMFLPENTLVASTQGRTPESNFQYKAAAKFYTRAGEPDPLADLLPELRSIPMVVLMDSATSSGAEIVAAALKDNRRATLVGHKTGGLGSVQTIRPLSQSDGLKLTTSYWFSPNGARIHGTGVSPDVLLADPNSEQAVQEAVAAIGKFR